MKNSSVFFIVANIWMAAAAIAPTWWQALMMVVVALTCYHFSSKWMGYERSDQ